jgi:hypothetical protein
MSSIKKNKPATMKLFRLLILLSAFIPALDSAAQRMDSSIGAGSKPFRINGSRSFWMGANYRKEWNTPVAAPVIDLATVKGGLTPTKRGGGKQTRSLRLEAPDGKEYNIRSIQKFITAKTLPGNLQSEAAADLVADGVSASYPYSALSVQPLAQAAGIPYNKVELVYIGDDPRLGEHRADFGNMLALLEQRLPDSVKKGWDTDEVVEKLKEDNDNVLNQYELVRVRILDMFVMDFDRHEDQWTWGAYDNPNGKGKTYYPIAKDRDQAFYVNQGVLPGIVKWPWLVPQLQGFRPEAKNIKRFNLAARNVDRFFMNQMTMDHWREAVDKFISQMTDAVIDNAVAQQPIEIRHISGGKIAQTLKDRRKYLADEVMEYYRFLAEMVDITGSDKKELFDITRNDDGSVLVQVYKITKEGEQSTKMYERKFDPEHTKELRLYGFGGEDKFVVKGSHDQIKIRMIGGEGEDAFESTNTGNGGFVYDAKGENTKVTGDFRNKISKDTIVNTYNRLGFKYNQVIPFISAGFNQDDGVFLGGWLKIIRHGFRKEPYKNSHTITINTAFGTGAWNFKYNADFIGVFGRKSDLVFDADVKAPFNTTNFFGYGMESVYDKTSPDRFRFYRARYSLADFALQLRKRFSPQVIMTLGPTFQNYKLDQNDKFNKVRFITQTAMNGLDPATLFSKQAYFGGKFSLTVDTRDNLVMTRKGVNWLIYARHLVGMNDASYDNVTQLNTDFTFYLSIIPKRLLIANRVGGGHNIGDFEFYQAQYLGQEDNLRGYRKYRFAGRSKFYNNTELRVVLARFTTYLFPGSLGIYGFYDTGRVWVENDNSDKWAAGYGGGFWISPLNRVLLTITYAASKEDRMPLVSLGWKF